MQTEQISAVALKEWREKKGLNQDEVGAMLGGVTGPTVGRWENGQDIPGPAQLLLAWLIHGKVPFGQEGAGAGRVASAAWKVEMTLEAFEKLRAKALAAGYEDVVDYIAQLVLEDLAADVENRRALGKEPEIGLLADAVSAEPVGERKAVMKRCTRWLATTPAWGKPRDLLRSSHNALRQARAEPGVDDTTG